MLPTIHKIEGSTLEMEAMATSNLLDSLKIDDFLTSVDDTDSLPWEPNSDNFDLNAILDKFVANANKARRTTQSQVALDMYHCVSVGLSTSLIGL